MRIKLENFRDEFNTETGESCITVVTEYACGGCRTLVQEDWKYCRECGQDLQETSEPEHHGLGGELPHKEFEKAVKMSHNEAVDYIKAHLKKGD